MKVNFYISEIIKAGEINNELDFQRGKILSRKLRLLNKVNEEAKITRKATNELLYNYEQKHWDNFNSITDGQIKANKIIKQIAKKNNPCTNFA